MKNIIKSYILPAAAVSVLAITSCSKLDPKLEAPNSIAPTQAGGAPSAPSIAAVYEQLNQLTGGQGNWFGLQEHSTDQHVVPTGMTLVLGVVYTYILGVLIITRSTILGMV